MNTILTLPAPGVNQGGVIAGPVAPIEFFLSMPTGVPWGCCVVCHPHPLHGGAMSNKVVYALASTAIRAGLCTLRFNFRGVGASGGEHDAGRGEVEDTIWLAQSLRAAMPHALPLVLAGFSFGAFVSLRAASRLGAAALMSVAPPFANKRAIYVDEAGGLPAPPGCPWTAIHSRDDEVVAYQDTVEALAQYTPAPQLVTVDGAGHFFHGRLEDVRAAFTALLETIHPSAP